MNDLAAQPGRASPSNRVTIPASKQRRFVVIVSSRTRAPDFDAEARRHHTRLPGIRPGPPCLTHTPTAARRNVRTKPLVGARPCRRHQGGTTGVTGTGQRIWIDLANTPHVLVFTPIVERLRREGWEVVLTARDHAQTLDLARAQWPDVVAIGGGSPAGRWAKARTLGGRARALHGFARRSRPAVALSHGSYAQLVAASAAGVATVTMMDYEHQPANHLAFRLARRVIVPDVFPEAALRRFGASAARVLRYRGFKEELYLAGFQPDDRVIDDLGIRRESVIAVLRTPPHGALYHRGLRSRFDELLEEALGHANVCTVLLPRDREQARRYAGLPQVVIPATAIDAPSLVGHADLMIGGGGTMTRESALLGTPTYTVFAGAFAAVDAELVRLGRLHDLRAPGSEPRFEKRMPADTPIPLERAEETLRIVSAAVADVAA